jgi:glycerol kinase
VTALVLGLDQGTSSTRCVALGGDLVEHGASSVAVASSFPGSGLVEQDPEEIAESAERAIAGALAAAGAGPRDVAALGIANQTETFVVWQRATGRAIHPAIVWQDRRTDAACAELRAQGHADLVRERTGLELDATFPATKLRWMLDHVDGARAAAEEGRLACGDVAAWLLHRLAGIHVTDAGNAGRSLLCPLGGSEWDDDLLELFGVPRSLLPPIVDSDGIDAGAAVAGGEVPVGAAAGDQQASLFGLRCWEPGAAKVTLGTGAFVLAQAGQAPPRPPTGILASCAWRRESTTSYALEGFIPTAGAAADWFARIGALPAGAELDALLASGGGDPGLSCVPALQGFGSPTWDAGARGAVLGLSLGTTRADLARAVVDGILHQVADAVEAMGEAVTLDTLWVDGGLSRSDRIVQRLADLSGIPVRRTARSDSTALGAAMLAGLAAGVWHGLEALPEIPLDLAVEPNLAPSDRARERERWAAARELTARWR